MINPNSTNPLDPSQKRQPAEAGNDCPICKKVFGRNVTVTACCSKKIDTGCLRQAFQAAPLEARLKCPLCTAHQPDSAQSWPSSFSIRAQRNIPGSFNEPQGACLSQSALGDFSAAQIEAVNNGLWERAFSLQRIIQSTRARPTDDDQRTLSNMLIEAVNNESWDNAHRIQGIFEGTGARLMDDGTVARLTYEAQQALSDKLIEALNNESWDKADIFQKIIKSSGARTTYKVRELLELKLVRSITDSQLSENTSRLEGIMCGIGMNIPPSVEQAMHIMTEGRLRAMFL